MNSYGPPNTAITEQKLATMETTGDGDTLDLCAEVRFLRARAFTDDERRAMLSAILIARHKLDQHAHASQSDYRAVLDAAEHKLRMPR